MEKIYVVGHKRPDTDSVVSALAYAHLKNSLDRDREYDARRLGDLNPETEFVLERFSLDPPPVLDHVYIQVEDAMTKKVIKTGIRSTIYEAGNLMMKSGIRSVPVVDDEGVLVGLVTERKLSRVFLGEFVDFSLERFPPKVSEVIRILNGTLLSGDPEGILKGRLVMGAMSETSAREFLGEMDLLVVGDREKVIEIAIKKGVKYVVTTEGFEPSDRVLDLAKKTGVTLLISPHDAYTTARLIRLSLPVETVIEREPLKTTPDTVLKEFEEDLMEDKNGVAVVVDDDLRVVGVITRHDLINPKKKRVILVDHSEKSQAVDGIEEAEIVEIVDHHRLGGLETGQPIVAYIKPVGSTSTIVWNLFRTAGVIPPKGIAGAMMAAILSDTMILKSPTSTPEDEKAVDHISSLIGIDPIEFGMEMFRAKTEVEHLPPSKILNLDMKEFRFSKGKVAISQVEVIDPKPILKRERELKEEMEKISEKRGYSLFVLMVTDVMEEKSYIIAVGNTKVLERALGVEVRGIVEIEGMVSRKKQLVPKIASVMRGGI